MLWEVPRTIISVLPQDAGNIALMFLLLNFNWFTVSLVQYLNHEVSIMYIAMTHWQTDANCHIKVTEPTIQNSYISVYLE